MINSGTNARKLRPLSLSKLPRLSEGLSGFQMDEPPPSRNRQSAHYKNTSANTTAFSSSCNSYGFSRRSSPGSTSTNGGDPFTQLQDNLNSRKCRNGPDSSWTNHPPRTNWNVSDSNLPSIPSYNPPMIPFNCTYISDASPSIVAARIAQRLMRRSLIAEYDDAQASATVFAMDTGSFGIKLYKGKKEGLEMMIPLVDDNACEGRDELLGISYGVIVECTRIWGDVIIFHRNCQAVLAGARGETDKVNGLKRPLDVLLTSRFGCSDVEGSALLNRPKEEMHGGGGHQKIRKERKTLEDYDQCDIGGLLVPKIPPSSSLLRSSPSVSSSRMNTKIPAQQSHVAKSVCTSLEIALSNIERDHLDTQLLGMQSFVLLTDLKSSRLENAYLSSLCVLGSPIDHTTCFRTHYTSSSLLNEEEERDEKETEGVVSNSAITRVHERIRHAIMQPGDDTGNDGSTDISSKPKSHYHQNQSHPSSTEDTLISSDSPYVMVMSRPVGQIYTSLRRMAILAFTNALSTVLSRSNHFPLLPPFHSATLHQEEFTKHLASNLAGAARPAMVMLACAHDTALATRLLCLIIRYRSSEHYNHNNVAYNDDKNRSCSEIMIGVEKQSRKGGALLEKAMFASPSCHGVLDTEACRSLEDIYWQR